jgi:N-acetylneuraminic acid mutarotase
VHGGYFGYYNGKDNYVDDLHCFDPVDLIWTDLSAAVSGTLPTARAGHGFTLAGGLLYVFGGECYDGYRKSLSDFYSFDPVALVWTDLSTAVRGTPPWPRAGHGFTSVGGKLYVLGGESYIDKTSSYYFGDFRCYDPVEQVWTDLSAAVSGTAPDARYRHGFTSAGGKLFVFGGKAGGYINDLRSFDPVTLIWTDLSAAAAIGTPPSARHRHGLTSAEGKLYVYGGLESKYLNDLHSFDPVVLVWTDLFAAFRGTPPSARAVHGLTSAGGKLYVHGGCMRADTSGSCNYYKNDLRCFNPVTLVWTDLSMTVGGTPPQARISHGFTSAGGKLYVHGGYLQVFVGIKYNYAVPADDLYSFDPVALKWTDLSASVAGTRPKARSEHGFTSAGGRLYVFGGKYYTSYLNDLHSFEPVARVWTDLSAAVRGTRPRGRSNHGFTSAGGKLFVHGGWDGNTLSDLHCFDPVALVWTDLSAAVASTAPSARSSHGFTSVGSKLFVFGGNNHGSYLNDHHSLDLVTLVWTDLSAAVESTQPSDRAFHGFVSAGTRLYVHGGMNREGAHGVFQVLNDAASCRVTRFI